MNQVATQLTPSLASSSIFPATKEEKLKETRACRVG